MTSRTVHRWWLVPICAILGATLMFVGCSDDKGTSDDGDNDQTNVNAYLADLPTWEEFAEVTDTADVPVGGMVADMSNMVLCTSTPYSITQNPEEIVTFGSAPNVLYLGSLIQGNTYLGGLGTMEELPIRQRAPLVIAVNLFSGTDIVDTVDNPDGASVQASLNTIISEASNSGHVSGSRIYYNKQETYSLSQASLKLGVSIKYMDFSARTQLNYSSTHEEKTVTAYFKQIMYEAYIVPPQTPAQFFNSDFTMEKLNEQIDLGNIGPNNLPVYVGKIQYGRMMMFTMTSTADVDSMKLAIEGSYSGFGDFDWDVEVSLRNILQSSEYTIVTIGGTQATALAMLKSGTLADYFTTDDPLTSALPLAYTLYNVTDGSIAKVSETTEYDVQECSAVNALCYTNKTEWQNRVAALAGDGHIVEFLTTPENLVLSDQLSTPPTSGQNMGLVLTFDSSSTHYPFTFDLQPGVMNYPLVYWNNRYIHIGAGGDENDNFEISIPVWHSNAAVFAIGITVYDNEWERQEDVHVHGINDFSKSFWETAPHCPSTDGFLGVVATMPLIWMGFDEGDLPDDLLVRDFCFGVLQWTD